MKEIHVKNVFVFVLIILGLVTYLTSCQDWVDEKYVATLSKKYKYNIVGISGPQSVTPYIELRYCKVDEQGENVMVSEMVSSPFLMGGHEVNILCDSVIEIIGHSNNRSKSKATGKYRLILRHQYEETGAEYLRIINHSTDKSIEFFIAGAQEMKTNGSGCNGWGVIDVMPTIYYKHAPVYYLLFPERKYTQNLQGNSFDCSETFYFEGNRCGDLELDQAWSVEEVMALYRAEYNNSLDVMLYIDIHFDDLGRLNKAIDSGNPHVKYKRFYGVIMPGEKLKGGADTPLLATPSLFDDDL